MSFLRYNTGSTWLKSVMADFDLFLQDHAAAEKKASGMAVSMLSHYPDKRELVTAMTDLAIEEMNHFREVVKLIYRRGGILGDDQKDEYINRFRQAFRRGSEVYFLDRLLVAGIIEARGCERFGLIADDLPSGELKEFYAGITRSEARHHELFIDLAQRYFAAAEVAQRLDELLDFEAAIVANLPARAALH